MSKTIISTAGAPAAIGPYSQAVRAGQTVYLSGQIALDPVSSQLVEGGFDAQVDRAFGNLKAVAQAAGGSLGDAVKLPLFLTALTPFPRATEILQTYFSAPYPARS
ncbi:MAG: Rid family detoxifying hydrolase, partial [Burkholderiales bacterium]|nr:Rid family detoxifying hydrolase [Burkholderiales bacterium]